MANPWTSGSTEILHHAVDQIDDGSAFEYRLPSLASTTLQKFGMAQFAINYRSCSTRVVSLMLLLLLTPPGFAEQEIAVLTIRKDNIHKLTSSELLPIAKVDYGRFQAIAEVEATDTRACAPINFAGWERAGAAYDVLYRGGVIGRAITTKRHRGNYSCSELCVVRAATTLKVRAPGIKTERQGFDPSGTFDESVTQYVAYSTTDGKRPYSTRVAAPLTKSERVALETYAKTKLGLKNPKTSARVRVLINSVEPFVGSKDGEVNVFLSAVVKRPNGEIRAITSVVRRVSSGTFESLFEAIEDGDENRGAPSYKMMDAVDFDGDGTAELLVIYNNYEFHEFQILQRMGSKLEIVHKGPSYGC